MKKQISMYFIVLMASTPMTLIITTYKTHSVATVDEFLQENYFEVLEVGEGDHDCECDEIFTTKFTAITPVKKDTVEGCVCEGIIRGKIIKMNQVIDNQ